MVLPPRIENPDPYRWRRRSLTIPLGLFAAPLATPIIIALLPFAVLYDRLNRKRSIGQALCFFGLFFWLQCLGIMRLGLAWLKWSLHRNEKHFLAENHRIQLWWSSLLFRSMSSIMGIRFEVEGETPLCGGSLVFVRHASVADTVLPIGMVSLPQELRVRYVLKSELKWDPCLDIAGQRLPNAFVQRGAGQTEIKRTAELAIDLDSQSAVVIYPEGTRFTPSRKEALIKRFAEKKDSINEARAIALNHCLPPRFGGVTALIHNAPNAPIVIMGHHGFEGATKLSNLFNGTLRGTTVTIKFWTPPPPPAGTLKEWLDQRWKIMDEWVTNKENSATISRSN